ncbi:MAG: cytochrome b/b6 domain-containing protein [Coriobacteriia bacterium]|nr:cytochrome b/b6 domain-containing protein [Coriobacteriia bacterium]
MSAILLAQVNVWMDAVFLALWIGVLLFVVFHFSLSVPKGRYRKKFIEGKWPEHDHTPVALPKLMHWIHLVSMVLLGFTGLMIRFPAFDGWRTPMRYIHYVAMTIVLLNLFWRLWYAFLSKDRDYKKFAVTKRDMQSALGVLAYYGYFSNNKPHVAEYNVMQKMSYLLFLAMMLAQGFTGLALLTQPFIFGLSPREVLLGWWLAPLLGDVAIAGAWVRVVHYALTWLFILMTTIHIYLAVAEDLPISLDFFGFKKYPEDKLVKGGHGHEEPHAPAVAAAAEAD